VPRSRSIASSLESARLAYWEEPSAALEVATRVLGQARQARSKPLQSRAIALQGAVSLHGGDLTGAFALAAKAERLAGDDTWARAELASLNTHLHFFSGAYADSLRWAHEAIAVADRVGDRGLRLHARRMACLAFGNLGVDDLAERFGEVLDLAREADSPWEEAVAHNDLAHLCMTQGEVDAADEHLAEALRLADSVASSRFLRGVVHATRAELRLTTGSPQEALADAQRAVALVIEAARDANPYLLGMAVLVEVQALLALGRVDAARNVGESAIERLGERVPQARSMILTVVAGALRGAGRAEEAYDTLARAAGFEREALAEFPRLLLGLERARLEAAATRREADVLAAKNRELRAVVTQLTTTRTELEGLQDQLRDQADRDWLTGLRNRRFLARELNGLMEAEADPVSFALLDLDHFKSINDRFGHQAGDDVLVQVGALLLGQVRGEDVVVRSGGEEFVVLMPGARLEEAAACCERLGAAIAGAGWETMGPGLTLTASIGVVSTTEGRAITELEQVADERLYEAKRAGRARVVAA
jgi:diguanylate cyclase (GGDEF)-like protein